LAGTGIPYSTNIPNYTTGQQTTTGGFLSSFTADELNALGQTVGALGSAILQIRQQSQQAQTQEEQLELQRQAQELERQRIMAMNELADAQRRAGVPVTAGQGLSTGAIIGIVAGSVLVLGLILFLAFRPKN
jgi:GAF domain-containing protein